MTNIDIDAIIRAKRVKIYSERESYSLTNLSVKLAVVGAEVCVCCVWSVWAFPLREDLADLIVFERVLDGDEVIDRGIERNVDVVVCIGCVETSVVNACQSVVGRSGRRRGVYRRRMRWILTGSQTLQRCPWMTRLRERKLLG